MCRPLLAGRKSSSTVGIQVSGGRPRGLFQVTGTPLIEARSHSPGLYMVRSLHGRLWRNEIRIGDIEFRLKFHANQLLHWRETLNQTNKN